MTHKQTDTVSEVASWNILQRYDNSPILETAWESAHFSLHTLFRHWQEVPTDLLDVLIFCHWRWVPTNLLDVRLRSLRQQDISYIWRSPYMLLLTDAIARTHVRAWPMSATGFPEQRSWPATKNKLSLLPPRKKNFFSNSYMSGTKWLRHKKWVLDWRFLRELNSKPIFEQVTPS